jgi:hypothetical protein
MTSGDRGSIAMLHGRPDAILSALRPVLINFQVAPQSVDLKIPLESAPANITAGLSGRSTTEVIPVVVFA